MYLAIEGVDTAGKSTQVERLGNSIDDALVTREPGGTPLGMQIREMVLHGEFASPVTELMLFLADRSEHVEAVVKPNLHRTVISDRSVVSGMAYAMVKKEFPAQRLVDLHRFVTRDLLPDRVFVLKLTPEELANRLSQKSHDKIESRGTEYLLAIQDALIEAAAMLEIPCHVIDARLPVEAITNAIISTLKGDT